MEVSPQSTSTVAAQSPSMRQSRLWLAVIAAAFTFVAIYGSLVPLRYHALDWQGAIKRFAEMPFTWPTVSGRADWVANVLLFVPLGYFWLGVASLNGSRGARVGWLFVLTPLLSLLSAGIEFTQIWFPPRVVSLNDIVAETLGAFLGATLWLLTGEAIVARIQRFAVDRRAPGLVEWLLLTYLAGYLLFSVWPLDLTLHPNELVWKLRRGDIQVVPFLQLDETPWQAAGDLLGSTLCCLPIGALTAVLWRKPNERVRSFTAAFLLGIAVVAAIELAQVFVNSQVASTTELLAGAIGIVVGIGLVRYAGIRNNVGRAS